MSSQMTLPILGKSEFEAARARRSFLSYCELVHEGRWTPARHHRLIAEKLQEVADGKCKRLMVWLPPRHGKSMEITETFPSYFLGRHPEKHVIEVSYNNDFAEKFGLANRLKVERYGYQIFGHNYSEYKATKTNWSLDNNIGGMLSVGVGGAITGEGADLLLIDDPIKNRQEAESETYRRHLYEEYQSTLYTRVQRNGAIIIVMTRWHEDDICGKLLNPSIVEPEHWEILDIPAVCETEDDPLGREIGETIWPEIGYDKEWAVKTKAAVGTYAWAGMYQQRPAPLEGGLFKRSFFKFYKVLPGDFNQVVQSWDCTFKEADTSDFVAGHVWGRKGADFYLMDRVHAKMGITATMQSIRGLTAKWPNGRAKLIEEAANGAAVIELLRREISGIKPIHPDGGKVVRAQAIMPFVEAGNVWLPDPSIAPWVHDFVEECANFPNALHDDDVDAMTQALNYLGAAPQIALPPTNYGNDKTSYWQK